MSRDLGVKKDLFIRWLADGLNEGRGWDQIVFDMLTAEGGFKLGGRGNPYFAKAAANRVWAPRAVRGAYRPIR
ncbi:MAG: hypothetical protein L0Y71_06875 [Gemmataceae bacterium]|nr:hypothetical protein [Gemmataceae bacterium]